MKTFISLLRGINVSGQNKISMPRLKEIYESLNLVNVVTYIQTGNVVFDYAGQNPSSLEKSIEAEIARTFRASVRVLLRDKNQFKKLLDNNPFTRQRNEDPEKLHVTFLSDSPSENALSKLTIPRDSLDEFQLFDKEVFLFCPNGYGRTKISNAFFERKLSVAATTRNWKTVNVLYEITNQRLP